MYFITRFFNSIRFFFMQVFQPLSNLQFQLRSAWMQNPVFQAKRMAIGMRAQAGYLLNQPRHYMRMIFPSGTLGRFKIPGFSGKVGKIENPLDDVRDIFGKKDEAGQGRRFRGVPLRAQFSQIHLIEPVANIRHVLHIGTVVGQSASDIKLEHPSHQTVRVRFSQVDPRQHQGAPMLLTYLSGEVALEVDGNFTQGSVPIRSYARLGVGGIDYQIELFAYDRLPEITRVDAGWATNVGPVRDVNEDAVGIYQHQDAYMFVIADGVGGGYAGDQVSAFATQYMLSAFERNIKRNVPWPDTFRKAYAYTNAEVRNFFRKNPHPAGTTLTTVVIKNWQAYIGHIGDSVLYLYRNWYLEQITADHSDQQQVGYETEESEKSEGEVEKPVTRNMLLKAIGKADTINPDILTLPVQPGDCLLLLTDGISGVVPREKIMETLDSLSEMAAAKRLVELATEYKTTDNISALVIRVLEDPYERDSWVARPDDRVYVNGFIPPIPRLRKPREMQTFYKLATSWGCLVILLSLCASASLFGFYRLYVNPVPLPTSTPTVEPTIVMTEEIEETKEATATLRATNDNAEAETAETNEATATKQPTETREPTQATEPTVAPTIVEPTGRPTLVRPTSTLRPPRR